MKLSKSRTRRNGRERGEKRGKNKSIETFNEEIKRKYRNNMHSRERVSCFILMYFRQTNFILRRIALQSFCNRNFGFGFTVQPYVYLLDFLLYARLKKLRLLAFQTLSEAYVSGVFNRRTAGQIRTVVSFSVGPSTLLCLSQVLVFFFFFFFFFIKLSIAILLRF